MDTTSHTLPTYPYKPGFYTEMDTTPETPQASPTNPFEQHGFYTDMDTTTEPPRNSPTLPPVQDLHVPASYTNDAKTSDPVVESRPRDAEEECVPDTTITATDEPANKTVLECRTDTVAETPVRPFDEATFGKWCEGLVERLIHSRSVFVLEVYMVDELVLQVKLASREVTFSIVCEPWSVVTGRTVSTADFLTRELDCEDMEVLRKRKGRFSPSRLVRFILQNSEYTPIIVSSSLASLVCPIKGTSFIDRCVYNELLPGSQKCCMKTCSRIAHAISTDTPRKKLFCVSHVPHRGEVLLYNPLLLSLTTDVRSIALVAIDIREVFSLRTTGYRAIRRGEYDWFPLLQIPQPRPLQNKASATENFYETAANILRCYREHTAGNVTHLVGMDARLAVACCLLKAIMKRLCLLR